MLLLGKCPKCPPEVPIRQQTALASVSHSPLAICILQGQPLEQVAILFGIPLRIVLALDKSLWARYYLLLPESYNESMFRYDLEAVAVNFEMTFVQVCVAHHLLKETAFIRFLEILVFENESITAGVDIKDGAGEIAGVNNEFVRRGLDYKENGRLSDI
ncbi:UNVERIFIED_CONTAM: hypothetical protein HDU68_002364 [Siphonaria sp. JEL0065]|nr:hypothetical protein HDU68_002364 [Siphonaria sp. JEL0065]